MQIIGHHTVRERLRRIAQLEEHPQSFLFVGPEHVGKRVVAREFASILVGQEAYGASQEEGEGLHPDITLLEPEQVTEKGRIREKNISVEAVREGIHFLSRYPLVGKKRVLIVDNAHRLSRSAQNALLKTLEEPNATSCLVLVTHEPALLLETIHSRLQRVGFSLVQEEELQKLQDHPVTSPLSVLGRPGLLRMASRDPERYGLTEELLNDLLGLRKSSLAERLVVAERLAKEGVLAVQLLEWWVPSLREEARRAEQQDVVRSLYAFLDLLLETERTLRSTQANMRLQLEKLFLALV